MLLYTGEYIGHIGNNKKILNIIHYLFSSNAWRYV